MDSFGLVAPKFLKFLTRNDTGLNELSIPASFTNAFGERLPSSFQLKLRNGFLVPVDFDKRRGILKGLSSLYEKFNLNGGEMLVFEYYGRVHLNVYVLGTDCCEIEYPMVVNDFQQCNPVRVNLIAGGFRFATFVQPMERIVDEIEPPICFSQLCTSTSRYHIRFVLSNGKYFDCRYNRDTRMITGFRSMCQILGLPDLNSFHMLLITYDGDYLFKIAAFDANMVEVVFAGSPLSNGNNGDVLPVEGGFELRAQVQPSHMDKYCYGVCISSEFRDSTISWRKNDYIVAYSGNRSWKLQVKKSSDWTRTTIHDGWIEFRNDLDLKVGDLCVFECPAFSNRHFQVRVIRNTQSGESYEVDY